MEDLVGSQLERAYSGKKVLVTGNTGFKGSWLSIWLKGLGADVVGYALDPVNVESNFNACGLRSAKTNFGDIKDINLLEKIVRDSEPEIIFHLAAQPIVLQSYVDPYETIAANSIGTVNVLEVVRKTLIPKTVICITTDKCYSNEEQERRAHVETDRLGSSDPYSASKAMAELAIESYRRSFFHLSSHDAHGVAVSSVRAGNVIGGGDFSPYRILPDTMRAFMEGKEVEVRNPDSVRPWQHVLEPLSGYLWLGAKMQEDPSFGQAWNFGPETDCAVNVLSVVQRAYSAWNKENQASEERHGRGYSVLQNINKKTESPCLLIDSSKAAHLLSWKPVWDWTTAVDNTVHWFKEYQNHKNMYDVCVTQIREYIRAAKDKEVAWAVSPVRRAVFS